MTIHLPAETALALAMVLTDARFDLSAKRMAAKTAIDELIDFLDEIEGDPDLEPSLGWNAYITDAGVAAVDLEGDTCDEEDDGLSEPSLGASEMRSLAVDYHYAQRSLIVQSGPADSQAFWSHGNRNDLEENVEDEGEATNEDGGDILDEPHDALDEGNEEMSLGWSLDVDQRKASAQAPHYGEDERWECV